MRVLLIGAYGFIGSEIARALISAGHDVRGFGRDVAYGRHILPDVIWHEGDLRDYPTPSAWISLLEGVDAVVNASGLLQDEPGHPVETIQRGAIVALLEAAETAGVTRFVQISAANADEAAPTNFLRSKAAADRRLTMSSIDHAIIRPGLVVGRNAYGGTALIRMAAAMPIVSLLPREAAPIQCIGMGDLVAAVLRALDLHGPRGGFDLVEAQSRPLAEIVARHRAWLGLAPARCTVALPASILGAGSAIADLLGFLGWRSPLRRNAIRSLSQGISGDAGQAAVLLGRPPLGLDMVLAGQPAGRQDRVAARLGLLLPLLLGALFLMWAGSALFGLLSVDMAADLLVAGGVAAEPARLLVLAGSAADAVLALMLLHRRSVRIALIGTIALTLGYWVGATLVRPDLWTDPLAPLLKTLPALMLSLACLALVDKR